MRSSAGSWTSLLALLLAAASARAGDAPADLDALLRGMAGASGVEARFVERKELALLAAPLESRGLLYFVPPARMARFTDAPDATALVVDGDRVRFRDGAGEEQLDLSATPMARVFVDNFVVLFSGDRARLEALYEVTLHGDLDAWELRLTPRRPPLDRVLERVVLSGAGPAMREMQVVERDGDRTVTRFERVDADRRFDAAERARLFEAGLPLPPAPPADGTAGAP
jgi:hypothetical protein